MGKRYDYNKEHFYMVSVKGIPCQFTDIRLDRDTIPAGKYLYEIAGDDDSGADPVRIKRDILVNFYGSVVSETPLPLKDGILWLENGDMVNLP